jgi:hypothetical protein
LTIKRACRTGKSKGRLSVLRRLPQHFCYRVQLIGPHLIEIVRTNDLVIISVIESLLTQEGVPFFIADQHMSAVEGSLGFLPRRIMVDSEQRDRARRLLQEAGLAGELRHE